MWFTHFMMVLCVCVSVFMFLYGMFAVPANEGGTACLVTSGAFMIAAALFS